LTRLKLDQLFVLKENKNGAMPLLPTKKIKIDRLSNPKQYYLDGNLYQDLD
jgi:hypothetical protein